jgi:acetyl-CoA/propionyl-CoA carboxylase biotin carboxyl carrier protein
VLAAIAASLSHDSNDHSDFERSFGILTDVSGLPSLSPLLIANRGEIAVRIAATAHELGLQTIALFTEADRGAVHAEAADQAIHVAGYLDAEAIVSAAVAAGAGAIHPGYGFLSENTHFAAAVAAAGIRWVGPPPEAIALMGDKGRAKQLAVEAGVPVVPGTGGIEADAAAISAFAAEQGYPIVIKALAGGGGKGMRVVREPSELKPALAAAGREAQAAFGDSRVLAERYLDRPRHIEIQVLADGHGSFVHLGERECSLQRRHQKVIEEAPSPVVGEAMRAQMGDAATALARACGYEGAGTVEFIVPAASDEPGDREGDFYFLEMNTRLQVEHPVTEMVWGVDLVEQQLRVAAGEPLAFSQDDLSPSGHAIEARLYSEDPAAGFLPAVGTIRELRLPSGPGIRVDAGIASGSVIGADYDPMLAKVIAHGPDRETAIGRLNRALADLVLLGVAHNAAFSRTLIRRTDFREGRIDTGLLERVLDDGELALEAPADLLAAGAMALWLEDTAAETVAPGPWLRRLAGSGDVRIEPGWIEIDGERRAAQARHRRDGLVAVEIDGVERAYAVAHDGDAVWVGREGAVRLVEPEPPLAAGAHVHEGSLEAPMPGKVLAVEVANGDSVEEGDVLLILESMKMELQIAAPQAGVVAGLEVAVGDPVAPGQVLVAVGEAATNSGDTPDPEEPR